MRRGLALLVFAVQASASAAAGPETGVATMPQQAAMAAIREDQAGYLDLAIDAINGYGGSGGLTVEALEGAIALERAEARASLMRRFLAVDLDGDGAVTPDEVAIAADAASAYARARLLRLIERSDGDGDGRVSEEEIAREAQGAALRALPEDEAQALRYLMAFDANGNGLVTLEEARIAIALAARDDGA